jgi:23S rRNA pseudouridine2605 synthase
MFKNFGVLVEKLRRVKIGFLELTGLKPGEWRYLTDREVEKFRRVLKMDEAGANAGHE